MRVGILFFLIVALSLLLPLSATAQKEHESEMIRNALMYTVLDFDAIPAIDDPVFVSAEAADSFLQENEMVIGVISGMDVKAYSTWHLDHHEIVNDVVNGTPIAATW